ncbi:MAG: hypothetical protein NDJ89_00270 [Oligoflexia bacterium]|nr:hypothetical protein [Oligoflexia bacterium]
MATKKTRIESRAPTRIDLAGGTLDIWPLYLFLKDPLTINLGIDLFAEATLEESAPATGEPRILLRSADQNIELALAPDELATVQAPPALELHLKLLRYFARDKTIWTDLALSTRARSPAGAGLGGSSTLSIAIIGALATWARGKPIDPARDGEDFIEIVRDVETTVIQVPAGMQDYYGAMFGGLQSLQWGHGSHRHEWLPDTTLARLEERLLLFYSGQSRNSGINNWALFKSFIDEGKSAGAVASEVRAKFERINQATHRLQDALAREDWRDAGQAIAEEWATRRTLAQGITTPEIDRAFEVARTLVPDSAGKVCGAGGGGCFFIYVPNPADKERVQKAVTEAGARHLGFRVSPRGLDVRRA